MKNVTIKDVAKLAKVSNATVSRVLSKNELVNIKTREKVKKAIKELNYVPNFAAQKLSTNKSKVIGIVLNSHEINPLMNFFFSEVLNYITKFLMEEGYYTLYINIDETINEKDYIDFLIRSNRIDGLIFLRSYENEKMFLYLDEIEFPFSIIGKPNDETKFLWVDNDNFITSYNITNDIIKKGKTTFCFIGGSKKINVTKSRLKGFLKALEDNNIKFNENLIIESKFNEKEAIEKLSNIIKTNSIDAIITTDDIFAISAINLLEKLNIDNIEVSGYNNSYLKKYVKKDFTTVDINVEMLAKEATLLILKKVNKEKILKNHVIVKSKIIKGD